MTAVGMLLSPVLMALSPLARLGRHFVQVGERGDLEDDNKAA